MHTLIDNMFIVPGEINPLLTMGRTLDNEFSIKWGWHTKNVVKRIQIMSNYNA